jgi:hypothetical protein
MNLEEQILDELSTKMQSAVDREILWDMLKQLGWTRVKLSRFVDNYHAVDVTYWLDEHVKNPFEREGADFIFENSQDAMLFILKWKND